MKIACKRENKVKSQRGGVEEKKCEINARKEQIIERKGRKRRRIAMKEKVNKQVQMVEKEKKKKYVEIVCRSKAKTTWKVKRNEKKTNYERNSRQREIIVKETEVL